MKINIQMLGGRGASSSKEANISVKDRTNDWNYVRDENNKIIGYRLSENVEIRKVLQDRLDITAYGNNLYVNDKFIMTAGAGYTIPYLKKLGGIYQDAIDAGIKDPYVYYDSSSGKATITDRKTNKRYNTK